MEQAHDFIKSGKVGRVATITIDHPPTNSISTGILKQLAELVLLPRRRTSWPSSNIAKS